MSTNRTSGDDGMAVVARGSLENHLVNRTYRADIDGLRAIAVILVVLYHFGFGFPGGFLGVDVFFVISGFLITGLICRECEQQKFSMRDFWIRRIRRILPASLAVLLVVFIVGVVVLLPRDLIELAAAGRAGLLLHANIYFWRDAGYFSSGVELKPLLHFWSLAVEEQFYLFYPFYIARFPPVSRRNRQLLLSLFVCSFVLGVYGHRNHPSASFYLLPGRVWQLLMGGVLFAYHQRLRLSDARMGILGCVGLIGIVASACVPHAAWGRWFPPGLVPSVCASALLVSGTVPTTISAKLLTSRPLVFTGLISYSLYLWHWPVFSFLRHLVADLQYELGGWPARLAGIVVSVLLASASWRWLEEPIRRKCLFASDSQTVCVMGGLGLIMLVLTSAAISMEGFPERFDPQVLRYADVSGQGAGRFGRSMIAADVESGDLFACGKRDSKARWLLFGDSHAMCLLPGLELAAERENLRIDQATRFATAPLLAFDHLAVWQNVGAEEFCETTYRKIHDAAYDGVILFAAWESYCNWPTFERSLESSISRLEQCGKKFVIILAVPDQRVNVPAVLAGRLRRRINLDSLGVSVAERDDRTALMLTVVARKECEQMTVLDPADAIADSGRWFPAEWDGEALYSDNQHLSAAGSRRLGEWLVPQLGKWSRLR